MQLTRRTGNSLDPFKLGERRAPPPGALLDRGLAVRHRDLDTRVQQLLAHVLKALVASHDREVPVLPQEREELVPLTKSGEWGRHRELP